MTAMFFFVPKVNFCQIRDKLVKKGESLLKKVLKVIHACDNFGALCRNKNNFDFN